jgi:hypothetical protein
VTIPTKPLSPGTSATGKISWFGGQQTASGVGTNVPGIATYNQATLGGWWMLKMPNGRVVMLKQTDLGPAPWTGRTFDFSTGALAQTGYTQSNFPTDASVTGVYLGKSPTSQVIAAAKSQLGGSPTSISTTTPTSTSSSPGPSGSDWTHLLLDVALLGLGAALLFKGGSRTLSPRSTS